MLLGFRSKVGVMQCDRYLYTVIGKNMLDQCVTY